MIASRLARHGLRFCKLQLTSHSVDLVSTRLACGQRSKIFWSQVVFAEFYTGGSGFLKGKRIDIGAEMASLPDKAGETGGGSRARYLRLAKSGRGSDRQGTRYNG